MEELVQTAAGMAVDVRDVPDYGGGHLPGAVNVPLPDMNALPDLLAERASHAGTFPYILYALDGPGMVATNGAFDLEEAGYRGVVLYLGGLTDWMAGGRPTEP